MPQPKIEHESSEGCLRTSLQLLIDQRRFGISYQPIRDLRSGEVIAFEALTRPHASSGFASPLELFRAADLAGMRWDIEAATRELAIANARTWLSQAQLFINCSPDVIADDRFEASIASSLPSQRSASRVIAEITECAASVTLDRLVPSIERVRGRRVQVAIDDVGIGQSGLLRISAVRPGWLKLDRSLVRGIDRDGFRCKLVEHLAAFAESTGVRVIAEGIERRAERDTCRDLGIACGQGFLLGVPTDRPAALLSTGQLAA